MARADPSCDFTRAELVAIGDLHCLFEPDTHAVALLNDTAASTWRSLAAGGDASTVSADLISGWRQAGFFGRSDTVTSSTSSAAPRVSSGIAPLLSIKLGETSIGLSVGHEDLRELLAAAFSPLLEPGDAISSVSRLIEVHHAPTSRPAFAIYCDGRLLATCHGLADARRITLQAVLLALHGESRVTAILHAAAVVIGGRVILLAGATGSGKSTLTAALTARGAVYLGDDLIALDQSGQAVGGLPLAASIKAGSFAIASRLHPGRFGSRVFTLGARSVRYLDLSRAACSYNGGMLPVGVLILPHFNAGSGLEVVPITPEDVFSELISTGTEIVGAPRSIKPLVRLIMQHPSVSLRYGDLDTAVAQVFSIVEGT